jgi:hypothetical protein
MTLHIEKGKHGEILDLVPQVSCSSNFCHHSCQHYFIKCKTRSKLPQKYSDKAKEDKEKTNKNTILGSHQPRLGNIKAS